MKEIISVIIPCYRSAGYLKNTVREILDAFSLHPEYTPQIILIDDCSPDDTAQTVRSLAKDPRICGICLEKNEGQARAKMKGLPFVKGSILVFMDDDGQHDPRGIFSMMEKLSGSVHMVYAQFPSQKESVMRRLTSRMTNSFLSLTTGKPLNLTITSFFVLDQPAVNALKSYKSARPFIGGYIWHIFGRGSVGTVMLKHRSRTEGGSTYSFSKLVKLFFDLNTSMRDIKKYPKKRSGSR